MSGEPDRSNDPIPWREILDAPRVAVRQREDEEFREYDPVDTLSDLPEWPDEEDPHAG